MYMQPQVDICVDVDENVDPHIDANGYVDATEDVDISLCRRTCRC